MLCWCELASVRRISSLIFLQVVLAGGAASLKEVKPGDILLGRVAKREQFGAYHTFELGASSAFGNDDTQTQLSEITDEHFSHDSLLSPLSEFTSIPSLSCALLMRFSQLIMSAF